MLFVMEHFLKGVMTSVKPLGLQSPKHQLQSHSYTKFSGKASTNGCLCNPQRLPSSFCSGKVTLNKLR